MSWVYKRTEPGLWTVGFYTPSDEWEAESDHTSRDDAAARVHFLNGGTPVLELADATVESFLGSDETPALCAACKAALEAPMCSTCLAASPLWVLRLIAERDRLTTAVHRARTLAHGWRPWVSNLADDLLRALDPWAQAEEPDDRCRCGHDECGAC